MCVCVCIPPSGHVTQWSREELQLVVPGDLGLVNSQDHVSEQMWGQVQPGVLTTGLVSRL